MTDFFTALRPKAAGNRLRYGQCAMASQTPPSVPDFNTRWESATARPEPRKGLGALGSVRDAAFPAMGVVPSANRAQVREIVVVLGASEDRHEEEAGRRVTLLDTIRETVAGAGIAERKDRMTGEEGCGELGAEWRPLQCCLCRGSVHGVGPSLLV